MPPRSPGGAFEHARDGAQTAHVARQLDKAHEADDASRVQHGDDTGTNSTRQTGREGQQVDDPHRRQRVAHACGAGDASGWTRSGVVHRRAAYSNQANTLDSQPEGRKRRRHPGRDAGLRLGEHEDRVRDDEREQRDAHDARDGVAAPHVLERKVRLPLERRGRGGRAFASRAPLRALRCFASLRPSRRPLTPARGSPWRCRRRSP